VKDQLQDYPEVVRRDLIFSGCQGIIEKKLGIQLA
jgi:hypothetical protein